jgi:hypothetical protein
VYTTASTQAYTTKASTQAYTTKATTKVYTTKATTKVYTTKASTQAYTTKATTKSYSVYPTYTATTRCPESQSTTATTTMTTAPTTVATTASPTTTPATTTGTSYFHEASNPLVTVYVNQSLPATFTFANFIELSISNLVANGNNYSVPLAYAFQMLNTGNDSFTCHFDFSSNGTCNASVSQLAILRNNGSLDLYNADDDSNCTFSVVYLNQGWYDLDASGNNIASQFFLVNYLYTIPSTTTNNVTSSYHQVGNSNVAIYVNESLPVAFQFANFEQLGNISSLIARFANFSVAAAYAFQMSNTGANNFTCHFSFNTTNNFCNTTVASLAVLRNNGSYDIFSGSNCMFSVPFVDQGVYDLDNSTSANSNINCQVYLVTYNFDEPAGFSTSTVTPASTTTTTGASSSTTTSSR